MYHHRVNLGTVLVTGRVSARCKEDEVFNMFVLTCLYARHKVGDWGDISEEAVANNERAVKRKGELLSIYKREGYPDDTIWIITAANRLNTFVLFPDDYRNLKGENDMNSDIQKIFLNKEDCHCNIFDLYKRAAMAIDYDITENTSFDCRKIRCTDNVKNEVFEYYRTEMGLNIESTGSLWILYGPKADIIDPKYSQYAIYLEKGAIFERKDKND